MKAIVSWLGFVVIILLLSPYYWFSFLIYISKEMWAEARRQERAVKGLMFDLRKQAMRKAEIKQTKVPPPAPPCPCSSKFVLKR
jgi:hypothetical protein